MNLSKREEPKSSNSCFAQIREPDWRIRPLVLLHLIAIFLFASWIWPFTRSLWDQLDVTTFRLLNGSLESGEGWQLFWALSNHRLVDFLGGTITALVVIWWLWGQPREIQNKRCAAVCGLTLVLLVMPVVLHFITKDVFQYRRLSPTLVVEDSLRLSQLVPWVDSKDISIKSFPGDHAFILFSIAGFFCWVASRKIAVAACLMAVIFSLPRLFGGAHWLTDNIMGGLAPALLIVSWLLATPLHFYLTKLFLPIASAAMPLISKWLRIPEHTAS